MRPNFMVYNGEVKKLFVFFLMHATAHHHIDASKKEKILDQRLFKFLPRLSVEEDLFFMKAVHERTGTSINTIGAIGPAGIKTSECACTPRALMNKR